MLAQDLVKDSTAVSVQVFQATLLAAFNEVLYGKTTTTPPSIPVGEHEALLKAALELGQTYAKLAPSRESGTIPASDADYGFLDLLWRAQLPGGAGTLSVKDQLDQGVKALGRLLNGVSDPINTLKFLNNLLNAAANSVALNEVRIASNGGVFDLRGDAHSAGFIRELVKFGVEVVKVNPTVTTTGETAISEFLNTLLRGGDERKAQGGLNQFFEGLNGTSDRVKLLGFGDRLIDAAQLLQDPGLQAEKKDAKFLSRLLLWGNGYAALKPTLETEDSQFFLETVWQKGDGQSLQKGVRELEQFFTAFENPSIWTKALDYEQKVFKALRQVPALQIPLLAAPNTGLLASVSILAGHYAAAFTPAGDNLDATGFFASVWRATDQTIDAVAKGLQSFIGTRKIVSVQNAIDLLLDIRFLDSKLKATTKDRGPTLIPVLPRQKVFSPIEPEVQRWQDTPSTWDSLPQGYQFSSKVVNSRKALVIDPYGETSSTFLQNLPGAHQEADSITTRLRTIGFQVERPATFTIQDLLDRNLGDYGVVVFTSHGSVYTNGEIIDRDIQQNPQNLTSIESVMWTNNSVTRGSILQYRNQLINRSLVLTGTDGKGRSDFGVTPAFIRKYSTNQNSKAIVYLATCSSSYNDSLVNAFQDIGAGAVFGYTKPVNDDWARAHGTALFNALSTGRVVGLPLNQGGIPGADDVENSGSGARFRRVVSQGNLNLALEGS